MKINFVRHSLLNRGGDKMVIAYASYLANVGNDVLINLNLKNTVFCIHPEIKLVPFTFKTKVGTIVSALLEKHDTDILIADIIPMAILLAMRNRGKVIYFAQDYNENSYPTVFQKNFIRLLYFFGLKLLKIPYIAVSEEIQRVFQNRFKSSGYLVRNGVDREAFYPEFCPELVISKRRAKALLLFARNDYRKGYDLALEIVQQVVALSTVPVEVWVVGEQVSFGDEIFCRNFGYVPEDELRKIFSSADVFLYPSRSEGFPLMVIEAFACKCPVVTTEAISYAEHEKNSLVSAIGDVDTMVEYTLRLLADGTLADKIISGAFTFASEHSLERSSKLFERTLLHLCRQP
ncbi:MAG: glycosyltransferase family 4 protein [Geobacteraceae bacterium]